MLVVRALDQFMSNLPKAWLEKVSDIHHNRDTMLFYP